jgi:hypothetical protein
MSEGVGGGKGLIMRVQEPHSLAQVLDQVVEKTDGERVSLKDILRALGTGSYGPALVVVAAISMLPPISVTPGLPAITATLFLLLSAQMLVHRPYPWLPRRLLQFSVSRDKLNGVVERARPWARRLGKVIGPRLTFLVGPPFLNLIAVVCLGLALLTFILSPLPGGENIPAAAVLLFGLALTARDGLLALVGLLVTGGCVWALVYFWPMIVQGFMALAHALGF